MSLIFMAGLSAQESDNYKVEVGQFDKLQVVDNVNVVYPMPSRLHRLCNIKVPRNLPTRS